MRRYLSILSILAIVIFSNGCGIYSFTGANTTAKTVQIDYFENKANNGPASLSQLFTEDLKNKFVSETNLALVTAQSDLIFKGHISKYNFEADAPIVGETTAYNRLTIEVSVDFEDTREKDKSWSKKFSKFARYESSQNLSSIEEQLITEINDQLVDQIFNDALANW